MWRDCLDAIGGVFSIVSIGLCPEIYAEGAVDRTIADRRAGPLKQIAIRRSLVVERVSNGYGLSLLYDRYFRNGMVQDEKVKALGMQCLYWKLVLVSR